MSENVFRFKQFTCSHGLSAIKIGVDGVLTGAWADVSGCSEILDVGTGCGLIALMCAQRNPTARVLAIDIHRDSVEEAAGNFSKSLWSGRLEAREADFLSLSVGEQRKFNLIVSNPPFFSSGISSADTPRIIARHEGILSPATLIENCRPLLADRGRLSMITTADKGAPLAELANKNGLCLLRYQYVKGTPAKPPKRILLEFGVGYDRKKSIRIMPPGTDNSLILEISPGIPSDGHRALCRDFYLYY